MRNLTSASINGSKSWVCWDRFELGLVLTSVLRDGASHLQALAFLLGRGPERLRMSHESNHMRGVSPPPREFGFPKPQFDFPPGGTWDKGLRT